MKALKATRELRDWMHAHNVRDNDPPPPPPARVRDKPQPLLIERDPSEGKRPRRRR